MNYYININGKAIKVTHKEYFRKFFITKHDMNNNIKKKKKLNELLLREQLLVDRLHELEKIKKLHENNATGGRVAFMNSTGNDYSTVRFDIGTFKAIINFALANIETDITETNNQIDEMLV